MIQKYKFFDGGTIEFEDTKSVRELIQCAFDQFDFYEPFGMDIVTVFQCGYPKSNAGWFTTDTLRSCREEIIDREHLCFAYHMPEVFYFAEGGWGHHMSKLSNHPQIEDPVEIRLKFDDFNNTIIINGKYCFRDIINSLSETGYIDEDCDTIRICAIYGDMKYRSKNEYAISLSDPIMDVRLTELDSILRKYNARYLQDANYINYTIVEIC